MTGISNSTDEAQIIASILAGQHASVSRSRSPPRAKLVYAMGPLPAPQRGRLPRTPHRKPSSRRFATSQTSAANRSSALAHQHHPERSPQPSSQQKKHEDGVPRRPPESQGAVTPHSCAIARDTLRGIGAPRDPSLAQQAITDLPLIYAKYFCCGTSRSSSVNQSAEALGISIASVKVRLHRARLMLQKKLVPQLKRVNPKRRWFSWS